MTGEKYKYILAFCDWVVLNIAFSLALLVHSRGAIILFSPVFPYVPSELLFFTGYALLGLIVFQYNTLYNINVFLTFADQLLRLFESILYIVLGFAVLSFFAKSPIIVNSRLTLVLFIPIAMALLITERFVIFGSIFKFLAKMNLYQRRALIIGSGRLGKMLAANLTINEGYGIKIVGFLDDEMKSGLPVFRGLKALGAVGDVGTIAEQFSVDQIIICVEGVSSEKLLEILELCIDTPAQVKIASPLYDIIETFRFTERYGEIPVVGLSQPEGRSGRHLIKRIFDVVFAAIGILVLSPVFALIAVFVMIDSAGPIMYRQIRVGKNGRQFSFYKFRSMLVGSDLDETRKEKVAKLIRGEISAAESGTKIVDESKITRVGKFIRRTSLDELPQLFNVLRGDMSLVGPRPCLPYEWEHYEEWQKKRLACMPGCTGVWQVSGRNAIGFNDMVILDFYYIQNASLFLDLQLILKTIPVMILGKGGK